MEASSHIQSSLSSRLFLSVTLLCCLSFRFCLQKNIKLVEIVMIFKLVPNLSLFVFCVFTLLKFPSLLRKKLFDLTEALTCLKEIKKDHLRVWMCSFCERSLTNLSVLRLVCSFTAVKSYVGDQYQPTKGKLLQTQEETLRVTVSSYFRYIRLNIKYCCVLLFYIFILFITTHCLN